MTELAREHNFNKHHHSSYLTYRTHNAWRLDNTASPQLKYNNYYSRDPNAMSDADEKARQEKIAAAKKLVCPPVLMCHSPR